MFDVAGRRTVLLVSHNMAALKTLCSHGMHICEGRLTFSGGIDDTIRAYHQRDSLLPSMGADLNEPDPPGQW